MTIDRLMMILIVMNDCVWSLYLDRFCQIISEAVGIYTVSLWCISINVEWFTDTVSTSNDQ